MLLTLLFLFNLIFKSLKTNSIYMLIISNDEQNTKKKLDIV